MKNVTDYHQGGRFSITSAVMSYSARWVIGKSKSICLDQYFNSMINSPISSMYHLEETQSHYQSLLAAQDYKCKRSGAVCLWFNCWGEMLQLLNTPKEGLAHRIAIAPAHLRWAVLVE